MNKKGFTLIELVAVVGLIALIILVAFPNMTSQLKKSRDNNYKVFEDNIFLATETYINTYRSNYPDFKEVGDEIQISVEELTNSGYLKSSIVNPKTEEKISSTDTVTVTINEDMTYNYEFSY